MRNKSTGFTLVELMITLLVAGVLSAIALPNLRQFVSTQKTRSAADDLFYTLLLARSEALKRNADVTVTRTGTNWDEGWTVSVGVTLLDTHEKFKDVSIANKSAITHVTFNSAGRLTSGMSFFWVSSGTARRCVAIDTAGLPSNFNGGCQ